MVDKKASRWFDGEWVFMLSGADIGLMDYEEFGKYTWSSECYCSSFQRDLNEKRVEDLVLFDNDGNRRQTHKDMVRPFKDDNGEMMCSLCDLAFTSEDS